MIAIFCVGLFFVAPINASAADDYASDVDIIKKMIDDQRAVIPTLFPGVDSDVPSTWIGFVKWDNSSGEDRVVEIDLENYGLIAPVNLSGLTKLKILNLSNNASLGSVDVAGTANSKGALTQIDVSNCTFLTHLNVANNSLETLDPSGAVGLTELYCQNNELLSIDVTALTQLIEFNCSSNKLQSLNLEYCTNITNLLCSDNYLSSLDLNACDDIIELHCESNMISSLDLSNCLNLVELWCFDNNISSLNLTNLSLLVKLTCGENPLTKLDVSGLKNLEELNCYLSQISVLDTNGCDNLTMYRIYQNPLTSFTTRDGYICTTQTQGPGYGFINGYDLPQRTIFLRAVEKDGSTFINWLPITPSNTAINYPTLLSDEAGIPDLSKQLTNFVLPYENTTVKAVFNAKVIGDNSDNENTTNKSPNTGDSSKSILWLSLIVLAFIGFIISLPKKNSSN